MLLILGAGYIGAAVAELALGRGEAVVLADNWRATRRVQLDGLEAAGARVETADIRDRAALDALLDLAPRRVVMLAAQASRPISEREPDYTEQTNLTGARRVAEAVAGSGATALVYNKGMLTAFLYDLSLRDRSNGKRSLDNVYKELFRLYGRTGARTDGNRALVSALGGAEGEMRDFVRRYIESPAAIDLKGALTAYGLQILPGGARTHVQVADSLSRDQRDLLRQLGYNEKVERDRRNARPR